MAHRGGTPNERLHHGGAVGLALVFAAMASITGCTSAAIRASSPSTTAPTTSSTSTTSTTEATATTTEDPCSADPYLEGCPLAAPTTTTPPAYYPPATYYTYSTPPTEPPCPTGSVEVSLGYLTATQDGTTSAGLDNEPVYQWTIRGDGTIVNDTTDEVHITSMESTVSTEGEFSNTHFLDADISPTYLSAGEHANIGVYLNVDSTTEPRLSSPWNVSASWAGIATGINYAFCPSPTIASG